MATSNPRIAFRVAASPAIGGGHVVRSVSLADALTAAGASCTFFANEGAVASAPLLARSAHALIAAPPDTAAAAALAQAHGPFDWVVVDDYSLAAPNETPWRTIARKILVVDDLANRAHDCDLLLDSTPSRQTMDYAGRLVSPAARLLLGPAYAPLRGEFAQRRQQALSKRETTGRPDRLLVSFGLTDPGGVTAQVVSEIAGAMPDLAMDVVVGSKTQSWAAIQALGRPNIALHSDPPSMPDLMIAADIALGAGGSTGWERACLGLPSVVLILADNQRVLAEDLARRGALFVVRQKNDWPVAIAALQRLRNDPDAWRTMSHKAALICDGRGADRAALEMNPPLSRRGLPVRLKPAGAEDTDRIFAWQNEPEARKFSSNPNPPTRQEHIAWMMQKLDEPRCIFNIITEDDAPVGVLRLDQRQDGSFMVSILVAANARNGGVAGAALGAGSILMRGSDLWAKIDQRNIASLRSFHSAGFALQENGAYRRTCAP